MLLGHLELVVFLVVKGIGGEEAYGAPIARELERATRRQLRRERLRGPGVLESKRLVTSKLGDPTPERGGGEEILFCLGIQKGLMIKAAKETRSNVTSFQMVGETNNGE